MITEYTIIIKIKRSQEVAFSDFNAACEIVHNELKSNIESMSIPSDIEGIHINGRFKIVRNELKSNIESMSIPSDIEGIHINGIKGINISGKYETRS